MRDIFAGFGFVKSNVLPVMGAVIALGAVFSVNVRGYLSVLPSGMMATIGSDFVFNYCLQFSMAVAMASLLGWQFGDAALMATNYLSRLETRIGPDKPLLGGLLYLLSLEFLGVAKQLTLRYGAGVLAFCYVFSGFRILTTVLFSVELIVIWIVMTSYLEHRREAAEPLPLMAYADRLMGSVVNTRWKSAELGGFLPIAVFLSLLFSHELGEERAKRVLEREPVFLAKQDLKATAFATSSVGTVLAIWHPEKDKGQEREFILIGNSGEEIIRSR